MSPTCAIKIYQINYRRNAMSLTTNTEIYTKSIERYKENKTEFIQCTLVDFGKNYAEIDEIEFYDEEFKPISDMLLIPFSKYMEQDDKEEYDNYNDENETSSKLDEIIDTKTNNASDEFKKAFEALLNSDDNIKHFILMYMPKIDKDIKTKDFKRWLYTKVYPICKENIDNNNDFIIDKKTADKILSVIKTLYSNSEYETAFIITMHYIYFLRTLFVMQVFSDIYHNELAKHIHNTLGYLENVVYQIKKYGNSSTYNKAAGIILNYLKSFRESFGLSYQDSYMALLGVLLTDDYKPFNEILKYMHKTALSAGYIKCAQYYILSKRNPEKAEAFIEKNMKLEDIFLLAETYRNFNMIHEMEMVLKSVKNRAEKNSDAIDEYYNILCNAYENLGNFTQMINILYEKLENGYSDAFASIYNEIDHHNPAELERLVTNAEKYLEEGKLVEEYMFFCLYDYVLPIIERTSDERLLLYFTELLAEKQDEFHNIIYLEDVINKKQEDIMIDSDIQEKELFDKFFVKAIAVLKNKQVQSKKLQNKIAKLTK